MENNSSRGMHGELKKSPISGNKHHRHLVLLVDDEPMFCKVLSHQLETRGYRCEFLTTAEAARNRIIQETAPDIVLLDYFLAPEEATGLDICEHIKSRLNLPVIMLTSNDDEATIVDCFDAGADHYVIKPYQLNELLARMRSALRLYGRLSHGSNTEATLDNIRFNQDTRSLQCGQAQVSLTEKESIALGLLLANLGQVVDRETLYQLLYGVEYEPTNRSVDMLLARLRKKLTAHRAGLLLQPARNKGYRLVRDDT